MEWQIGALTLVIALSGLAYTLGDLQRQRELRRIADALEKIANKT